MFPGIEPASVTVGQSVITAGGKETARGLTAAFDRRPGPDERRDIYQEMHLRVLRTRLRINGVLASRGHVAILLTWSRQRMLGHASAAMTLDVYAGLFDDDLSDLAARMDAAAQEAARVVWARPRGERLQSGKRAAQHGGPRGDRTHNPRIKSLGAGMSDGDVA
jgi:hypothetical protein